MGDKDAGTPRVFLIRHGETEWSKSGKFTGSTELELTPHGRDQVRATGETLIGKDKLIVPSKIAQVYISPRKRARTTWDLMFEPGARGLLFLKNANRVTVTENIAEWDYGRYEGLLTREIRAGRKERGLDAERPWDIWVDGCEDGETPQQVSERLDVLVRDVRNRQRNYMNGEAPADVVIIAHGHILRAFAKRWLGYELGTPLSMMIEPAGVGILSYQHHSVDEPAFLLGMAFPVKAQAQ